MNVFWDIKVIDRHVTATAFLPDITDYFLLSVLSSSHLDQKVKGMCGLVWLTLVLIMYSMTLLMENDDFTLTPEIGCFNVVVVSHVHPDLSLAEQSTRNYSQHTHGSNCHSPNCCSLLHLGLIVLFLSLGGG